MVTVTCEGKINITYYPPPPTSCKATVSIANKTTIRPGETVDITYSSTANGYLPENGACAFSVYLDYVDLAGQTKTIHLCDDLKYVNKGENYAYGQCTVKVPDLRLPGASTYQVTLRVVATWYWGGTERFKCTGTTKVNYEEPPPTSCRCSIELSKTELRPGDTVDITVTSTLDYPLPAGGEVDIEVVMEVQGKKKTLVKDKIVAGRGQDKITRKYSNVKIPTLDLPGGTTYGGTVRAYTSWKYGEQGVTVTATTETATRKNITARLIEAMLT